jgi:hypothetical protein
VLLSSAFCNLLTPQVNGFGNSANKSSKQRCCWKTYPP